MTFHQGIASFLAVLVSARVFAASEVAPPRFERALALYAEGPCKAGEVIALLTQELESNPDYEPAIKLLGITYFGTGRFQEALAQFDHALALADARQELAPRLLFYKARALHELGKCADAKRILEAYWAFWQDDTKLKAQYDELYPELEAACGAK